MEKKEFEKMDKEFKDTIKRIRDWADSDDVEYKVAIMGARYSVAQKFSKGHVSLDYDAPKCMVDISGNKNVLLIAMQQLVEHFGIEQTLELIAATSFMKPKTVNIFSKRFESKEEKEVFKRVMNMTDEE